MGDYQLYLQARDRWAFSNTLMFTLSVITTLGYGNTVPTTKYGKIVTMIYAVFGIPVYILYFRNIGQVIMMMMMMMRV